MGDRGLPRVNRLVALRENEFRYNLHKASVRKMKSAVDNLPPPVYPHLTSQAKKKQVAIERMAKVERENLYLLEKMRRIMVEPQTDMAEPFMKGSLNRESRKRDMVKIMNENEALLRRIQSRAPNYDVGKWEKDHVDKEKLLANIGEFPYRSATVALPPRRGKLKNYGRSRALPMVEGESDDDQGNTPHTAPGGNRRTRTYPRKNQGRSKPSQPANDRTCVFSQNNLSIRGVTSTLSVYERLNPFRLEFVALDENCQSQKNAVSVKFTDLRQRFEANVDLLKPERTDDLVHALLEDLYFAKAGNKLILKMKEGGPDEDDAVVTGNQAGNDDTENYDDEPVQKPAKKKPVVDFGEVNPCRFTVKCEGVSMGRMKCLVVLSAKNEKATKFEWVARTELVSGASRVFKEELKVDMYEKLDRELKLTVYGCAVLPAKKKEAKQANTMAGEACVQLSQFLALPNGKLELNLTNNGRQNGTITLFNPDCSAPEPEPEPVKKVAKKKMTPKAPAEANNEEKKSPKKQVVEKVASPKKAETPKKIDSPKKAEPAKEETYEDENYDETPKETPKEEPKEEPKEQPKDEPKEEKKAEETDDYTDDAEAETAADAEAETAAEAADAAADAKAEKDIPAPETGRSDDYGDDFGDEDFGDEL